MSREEERALLERCRAGDREAYEPIVRATERRLYGYLHQLTGDPEEARDLTQDTFVRVYTRLHRYRSERPLVPWLFAIARNLYLDDRRRRNGRNGEHHLTSLPLAVLPDPGPAPDQAAIEREDRARLWQALNELSPAHREILVLKDIEGLEYREIASILNVPPGTVGSRVHAARRALRELLTRTGFGLPVCA